MIGIEHYPAFVLACVALNLTPGADTLYILTRAISQGRWAGLWSALGISSGCLVHTAAAAGGLSLLLASSATAFTVVKMLGAGYLVWLGVTALLGKGHGFTLTGEAPRVSARTLFLQGLATNVLNPKVALFFLAFLPQFVDPTHGGPGSFALLGLTFFTTGTLWCLVLAFAASMVTATLRRRPGLGTWLNRGSGVVFLGMGAAVLVGEHK